VREAFCAAFPLGSGSIPRGLESYIRKVMARLAWRAHRQPFKLHPSSSHVDTTTADIADTSAELTDLRQALVGLPSKQRVVLVLRYWQDLNEAEIAELLGCRQGTVKSRASRAYAQLRQDLGWTDDVAIADNSPAAGRDVP
jgi:RNA polymerase sigma factor (sigma-70 family)